MLASPPPPPPPSPMSPSGHPPSQSRAASRILTSVRRSITKRQDRSHSRSHSMHMYSTPEERSPSLVPATFRDTPATTARPTVEQIAMGLHVSRTPHLHSSPRLQYPRPASSSSSSPLPQTLLSPPLRSSLKKPRLGHSSASASVSALASDSSPALNPLSFPPPASASASTSTITSASLHLIPGSAPLNSSARGGGGSALAALKLRVARLLPGEKRRSSSSPAQMVFPRKMDQETLRKKKDAPTSVAARKAVRFEPSIPPSPGGEDDEHHR